MNSFRVDELVLTFDELKPFSDVLQDETQMGRLHKIYRNLEKYDDSNLLRHLLVLVSFMEHSLKADPPLTKALQNYLIELTSLIEKTKAIVSRDYANTTMGILFKYSGALLDVQPGSDAEVSLIFHSLAYHHLSTVSSKDVELSAWIALHLLETTSAITCNDVSESEVDLLWDRDDLAEYCVDNLIPAEGGIQRLHARAYRDGIRNCSTVWPAITVKHIKDLFNRLVPFLHRPEVLRMIVWMIGHDSTFEEMSLFDDVLNKPSIGKNVGFVSTNLTSVDIKVFLFTLSLWSDSYSCPVRVPARLRIRCYQINCWKGICQLINNSSGTGDVKSVLLRTRVIDSVRLRHRVVSLRRLYEVFRWLEVNVKDEFWLTLYATTISDTITGTHAYRKKCDELFPDGTSDEEDLTVDEVDRIEEHVSRFIAMGFLNKEEFGEAERRLVYARSIASRKLLIKVYQTWLERGYLEDQDREQLLKRVRDLQAECHLTDSHEDTPTPSSPVSVESGEDDGPPPVPPAIRRLQVDASTNTPVRADTSSQSCGADESFFSVKSQQTNVATSDRSFASAIASPLDQNSVSVATQETSDKIVNDWTQAQEPRSTGSLSLGQPREQPHTALSLTDSHSITVMIPSAHQEKPENVAQPVLAGRQPSVSPNVQGQTTLLNVSTSTSTTPNKNATSTSSSSTASALSPIVVNSPFGKFITNKEAATSFWKSGKAAPVFGTVPPCLASTQQKPEQKGQASAKSVPAGSPRPATNKLAHSASATITFGALSTVQSSFSPSSSQSNVSGGHGSIPSNATPTAFTKPRQADLISPHPNVSTVEESTDEDDENFYNDLIFEMCKKQWERGPRKPFAGTVDDMETLQKKIAQMNVQVKNAENQLHTSTTSPAVCHSMTVPKSGPTQAELQMQRQRKDLQELEQQVVQVLGLLSQPTKNELISTLSSTRSTIKEGITAGGPSPAPMSCADTMSLFQSIYNKKALRNASTNVFGSSNGQSQPQSEGFLNPLQKMEQLARHPGCNGVCFGCLDDEIQERALETIDRLAREWNSANDSDNE